MTDFDADEELEILLPVPADATTDDLIDRHAPENTDYGRGILSTSIRNEYLNPEEYSRSQRTKDRARVKQRLVQLAVDTHVLREYDPEMFALLQRIVCDPDSYELLVSEDRERQKLRSSMRLISGVGASTIDTLLEEYGSAASIRGRSADELANLSGIGQTLAERIVEGKDANGKQVWDHEPDD